MAPIVGAAAPVPKVEAARTNFRPAILGVTAMDEVEMTLEFGDRLAPNELAPRTGAVAPTANVEALPGVF